MTTTAWAHLPNARHIDAVLAHVKAHPERWRDADWYAARGATRAAARGAARAAAWDAARDAAWDAVLDDARHSAWVAAWDACAALVAWDDAGQLMDVPLDAVRTLAAAGHHPAILILPARLAMEETP